MQKKQPSRWYIFVYIAILIAVPITIENLFFWNPAVDKMMASLEKRIAEADFSKTNTVRYRFFSQHEVEKSCALDKIDCWGRETLENGFPVYLTLRQDYPKIYQIVQECNNCTVLEDLSLEEPYGIQREDLVYERRDGKCYSEESNYWNEICTRFAYNKNGEITEILYSIDVAYPKLSWLNVLGGLGYIPEDSARYAFSKGIKWVCRHNDGCIRTNLGS